MLLAASQVFVSARDVNVFVDGRLLPASDGFVVPAVTHDYGGFSHVLSTTAFVGGADTLRIVNDGASAVRVLLSGTKVASSASRSVTLVAGWREGSLRDVDGRGVVEFSVIVPPRSSVPVCFGIDFNHEGNFGVVVSSLVLRWGAESGVTLTLTHVFGEQSPVEPGRVDEQSFGGARDLFGRRLSLKGGRWSPGLYLVNRKKVSVR